jgi:outer membrane lipoprotein carrier protein
MLIYALALSLATQQSPADKAIDAAVAAYARVRTSRATFEQTLTNPLTGMTLKSSGTFEQERPDKFAFRFTDPRGDVIVADGRYVWLYLPSSAPGQVIRTPLSQGRSGAFDLIGEFFSNPRSRYAISDGGAATVDGRAARIVSLVPKNKDAAFVRAKVWIDSETGTLRQFEADEENGSKRQVRILSFTPNVTVVKGAFVFTPPKGVRIVDGASLTG